MWSYRPLNGGRPAVAGLSACCATAVTRCPMASAFARHAASIAGPDWGSMPVELTVCGGVSSMLSAVATVGCKAGLSGRQNVG